MWDINVNLLELFTGRTRIICYWDGFFHSLRTLIRAAYDPVTVVEAIQVVGVVG
jgi:hypothetical protein